MPKKTKREKIIAEYRRKIQLTRAPSTSITESKQNVSQISPSPTPVNSYTFQSIPSNSTKYQAVTLGESSDLTTIRKDLFKTLLLAIIAVSVEIGLYWKFR